MATTPLVSVIIPTFNRQEPLLRALNSVLSQTYPNISIIIVDDGSTDDTQMVLTPYIQSKSIKLITLSKNHGVSYARNQGIAQATGTYISFLDSDDTWHPKKLTEQVTFLALNPAYSVVQTNEVWIRNGVRVNAPKSFTKYGGEIFERCLTQTMITTSSVLCHHSVLKKVGTFNTALLACEDYDLWLRISARYPVGLIEKDLITRYSGAGDQLSETVPLLNKYRVLALINVLKGALLSPSQKQQAHIVLCQKLTILYKGAKKRKLIDEEQEYATLLKKWSCPHA